MSKIALVFPGQGSQVPGMGQALAEANPAAKAVWDEVSSALGRDIKALAWNSDEDTLRQTQNAQIALFTCGVAAARALDVVPDAVAGHSVGEYAALVVAGVLSLSEGARLIEHRGRLMSQAKGGGMAAVLGAEREAVEATCAKAPGTLVVANDNSPGQLVVSGDSESVEWVVGQASEMGAKRVLPLKVSGAFHSPLMADAAREMGAHLREATFSAGTVPVYANVTACRTENGDWADLLQRQLESPVRWTESVLAMREDGIETFVECGAGEVLTGLLKRIDKTAVGFAVGTPEQLETIRHEISR